MRTVPLLVALTTTLVAQKMPLPDGSGRLVQIFDMEQVLGADQVPPAALKLLPGMRAPEPAGNRLQAVADMLARFLEPPLGPGDDLRPLGDRRLVLLGSPAQVASAERLLKLAGERRDRMIDVQVNFLWVTDKAFTDTLKAKLVSVERDKQVTYETIVGKQEADQLAGLITKACEEQLDAPRVTVSPLQRATIAFKNQTAYVKDFTLSRVGETVIADPVVDVVWDGNETEVFATFLPDGMLGIACTVVFQEVQKPIATFNTTVAGCALPLTLQLPRVTGMRLQHAAVLADDSLVVLASQKVDGKWLVALVRAHARPK